MLENEEKLTLTEAAKRSPGRPHASTLWRWCREGLHGVRLEYARFGRRIFTSSQALERFASALAAEDRALDHAPPTLSKTDQLP